MSALDSIPLFDGLATAYDQPVPFFATFGRRLVDLIDPAPGAAVLDVGAGRGAVAVAAAERGCRVTAIDGAPRMVELLSRQHPAVTTRLMDAHRLDLADNTYDLATAAFVIHVVNDPAMVVAEMCRVVRPGGLVVLTVPGAVDDGGVWQRFNAIAQEYTPRPDRAPVARETDAAGLLAAARLADLGSASIEIHIAVDSVQRMWDFQMSHGWAGYFMSFTEADRAAIRSRVLAELQRMHDNGGIDLHRAAAVHFGRVRR